MDAVEKVAERIAGGGPPGTGCHLSVVAGAPVTSWSAGDTHADPGHQLELRIEPGQPLIIGRKQGGEVPYLDPAYRPTTVVPGTGQAVLRHGGGGADVFVSRGHFMLRAAGGGLLLVNGVPRRGGGIRPPLNWTWLLAPVERVLAPGEEYLIESGTAVEVRLPNGTVLRIAAR